MPDNLPETKSLLSSDIVGDAAAVLPALAPAVCVGKVGTFPAPDVAGDVAQLVLALEPGPKSYEIR